MASEEECKEIIGRNLEHFSDKEKKALAREIKKYGLNLVALKIQLGLKDIRSVLKYQKYDPTGDAR